MNGLWREIFKPVLKLDFTAHGVMESLSEYRLWCASFRGRDTPFFAPKKDFGDGFGWSKFHKWASAFQSGTGAFRYRAKFRGGNLAIHVVRGCSVRGSYC
jgi:hypothetical protein